MAEETPDPFGTIYQGVDIEINPDQEGKYVSYRGSWIITAYINLMIGLDHGDILKIKTLISYLHNNACALNDVSGWDLQKSAPYFIDVVTIDLYKKLGYGEASSGEKLLPLNELIDGYYIPNCKAEEMLLESYRLGGEPDELIKYLTPTEEEFYKPKTTLFSDQTGATLPADDATKPVISFPNEILSATYEHYKNEFTKTNMFVSDKTPNNSRFGQHITIYSLTNKWFQQVKPREPDDSLDVDIPIALALDNVTVVLPPVFLDDDIAAQIEADATLAEAQAQREADDRAKEEARLALIPVVIGHKSYGDFDLSNARSENRTIDGTKHTITSLGGIGKTSTHAFYYMLPTDQITGSTLQISSHGSISEQYYGKDNGKPEEDTLYDWTVRNESGQGDLQNIYISPKRTQNFSGEISMGRSMSIPVRAGEQIGEVGNTGASSGTHLHFELSNQSADTYSKAVVLNTVDPEPYFNNGKGDGFFNPLEEKYMKVGSGFGPRNLSKDPKAKPKMHEGVDLPFAPKGAPVFAAYDGVIIARTEGSGYGNVTVIKHHNGKTTIYAHLSAFTAVEPEFKAMNTGSTTYSSENANKIKDILRAKGYPEWKIKGIIANLMGESGPKLNPLAEEGTTKAYGIAQWLGVRKTKLLALPNYDTLEVQVEYLYSEIDPNGSRVDTIAKPYIAKATDAESMLAGMAMTERWDYVTNKIKSSGKEAAYEMVLADIRSGKSTDRSLDDRINYLKSF